MLPEMRFRRARWRKLIAEPLIPNELAHVSKQGASHVRRELPLITIYRWSSLMQTGVRLTSTQASYENVTDVHLHWIYRHVQATADGVLCLEVMVRSSHASS